MIGIYKDDEIFIKSYGTLPSPENTIDAEKVFQIASLTKVLTASLLQILVDQ